MSKWKWIGLGVLIVVVIPIAAMFYRESFGPQTRSISLQYISGSEAASVLRGHVRVEGWSERTVFVRGSNANYEEALNIIQKEDRPAPQVALKFQIIEADGFTQTDPAIAPVESALRGLFRFKGYRLTAEAFLQARENTEASQTIAGADDAQYSIVAVIGDVVRREGKASTEMNVRLLSGGNEVLATSVNVPDGQTVILGTARPNAKRAALILVVTPEMK
jgi:hypothetical protein